MELFNRYEYEQDPKKLWKKILKRIVNILVILVVISLVFVWKFSSHIKWDIANIITYIKYGIYGIICISIITFAAIKGTLELTIWVKKNKKDAKRYLFWIIISTIVLFAFSSLLAFWVISNNHVDKDVDREQQGQVSVSPNKEERLKIDNYEEVIISSHYLNVNSAYFRHIVG